MAEKKPPKTISIVYEEVPGRPVIAVGGAIGAGSPDGTSVIAHLYSEFATIPAIAEHEIAANGAVDLTKGTSSRRADITRLIQATLVLSPEAAIRLGNWLLKNATAATEHRKKNQPKPELP